MPTEKVFLHHSGVGKRGRLTLPPFAPFTGMLVLLLIACCGCEISPDTVGQAPAGNPATAQKPAGKTPGPGRAAGRESERMRTLLAQAERLAPLQHPMPPTKPGDWRSFWKEPAQTPQRYEAAFPVTISKDRSRLYLCRVGNFTPEQEAMSAKVREYLSLCFQCEVRTMPDLGLGSFPNTAKRTGPKRQIQINSVYLTDKLLKPNLPADGWGVMAITWHDIFTGDGLSDQYGDTLLFGRAGVISFYHFLTADPKNYLVRALKGASHETAHLLSIPHCSQWLCNMNGRAGLRESDQAPLHFCPDCLCKLLFATGADPRQRFTGLETFLRREGIAEADYFAKAAELWTGAAPPTGK